MFDSEDREQNNLDEQYVAALESALGYVIAQADGWYDDSTGHGKIDTPEMRKVRSLLSCARAGE